MIEERKTATTQKPRGSRGKIRDLERTIDEMKPKLEGAKVELAAHKTEVRKLTETLKDSFERERKLRKHIRGLEATIGSFNKLVRMVPEVPPIFIEKG